MNIYNSCEGSADKGGTLIWNLSYIVQTKWMFLYYSTEIIVRQFN